jgi:hypothetical protein
MKYQQAPLRISMSFIRHVTVPKTPLGRTMSFDIHTKYPQALFKLRQPGSSVSIVSGYGLDDREIEVRSLKEATDFSSNLCVQTGSGAHPAS